MGKCSTPRMEIHHQTLPAKNSSASWQSFGAWLAESMLRPLDFFEACRRKRNVIDYDHASVTTQTEAEEIVMEARNFFDLVERWIVANHPKFTP